MNTLTAPLCVTHAGCEPIRERVADAPETWADQRDRQPVPA